MKKKLENFAATFIESIAAKRHRNVEWAKTAVRESAAVTAEKALELKVIDILAKDIPDLLQQLDGREIDGRPLHTASAEVHEVPMLMQGKGLSDALASGGDVHPHARSPSTGSSVS